MFVYQVGNFVNIVKGTQPKEVPDIQVGFDTDGNTVIKIDGAEVEIQKKPAPSEVHSQEDVPEDVPDVNSDKTEETAE